MYLLLVIPCVIYETFNSLCLYIPMNIAGT
jgi:hypothetical protein